MPEDAPAERHAPPHRCRRQAKLRGCANAGIVRNVLHVFSPIGLGFLNPLVRLPRRRSARTARELWQRWACQRGDRVFLFAWSQLSNTIETSLGKIPGPIAVWQQAEALWADHKARAREGRIVL